MKTITKFIYATFAAFIPIPLLFAIVGVAMGASTANGAPGDLFVGDFLDGTIYKFAADGTRSTFAAGLVETSGLAFDSAGNLFAADYSTGTIHKFAPDGTGTTFATGLHSPYALAFDSAGNLFAADSGTGTIYKFAPDGTRSTFASGLPDPGGLAFDSAGNLFVGDVVDNAIYKFAPDSTRSTFATGLAFPVGLAFDSAGNLFEGDFNSDAIYKFAPDGTQNTFANGLNGPAWVAIQPGAPVPTPTPTASPTPTPTPTASPTPTPTPTVSPMPTPTPTPTATPVLGEIYVSSGGSYSTISTWDSLGNGRIFAASDISGGLGGPSGLAFDSNGNLYVGATIHNTIEKIDPAGNVNLFADSSSGLSSPAGLAFDSNGNLYVANAGGGNILKFDPAGNPTVFATISGPGGLAFDGAGNLYVSHTDSYPNGGVVRFDSTGNGTTFASGLLEPLGMAFDSTGNLYVANSYNSTITKIKPNGEATSFATIGVGYSPPYLFASQLNGLATDNQNNIYAVSLYAIEKFDSAGNSLTAFTTTSVIGESNYGVAVWPPPPTPAVARLIITSPSQLNGVQGLAACVQIQTAFGPGGGGTVTFSVINGALPSGITLSSSGQLCGTPNSTGTYAFTIQATDGNGNIDTKIFTDTVAPPGVPGTLLATYSNANIIEKFDMATGNDLGVFANTGLNEPVGMTFDSAGNLYVANFAGNSIEKFSPTGTDLGIFANIGLDGPFDVAFDNSGNLYVANAHTGSAQFQPGYIEKFSPTGTDLGVFANTGDDPQYLAFDTTGNLYLTTGNTEGIFKITPDGTSSIFANFVSGSGLSLDSAGNVYASRCFAHDIVKYSPTGTFLSNFAGGFGCPTGQVFDVGGNMYVADSANDTISRITPSSTVYFFANTSSSTSYLAIMPPPNTLVCQTSETISLGTAESVSMSIAFPNVTVSGITAATPIDPNSAGTLPSAFDLAGSNLAFDIATTAQTDTSTNPIIVAFQVPPPLDASQLYIFHNESGTLMNATCPTPRPGPTPNLTTNTLYASVNSLSPFVIAKLKYHAQVQQPINADGSSVFSVSRGVVPVKFTLTSDGAPTCQLPPATIAVTRTAGGTIGPIDESVYIAAADTGSNFRTDSCQYVYNLNSRALGVGTYRVDIKINGTVIGSGTFGLR